MRIKKLIWILGLSASLALLGGCSSAPEDASQTEESEGQAGTEDAAESVSDAPVRIYGTILEVGEDTITVDNQSESSSTGEVILTIDPENTLIADAGTGLPLTLADIQGDRFEAYLGPAMTMSLPPQTTPYVVIANIQEDGTAPQYAVAASELTAEDGSYTLEATDGRTWTIPEDVEIQPFRTRNIVMLEDLTEGRGCLIWQDAEGTVTKVVLFEG